LWLLAVQAHGSVLGVGGWVVIGMVTTGQVSGRVGVAQRWLARLALAAGAAAVGVPLVAIGLRASVAVTLAGVVGLGVAVAGVWWALTHKGLVRWGAVVVAVAAPLVVVGIYTSRGLVWVVVAVGLLVGAVAAGRAALAGEVVPEPMTGPGRA
jgi:hypothetical protein